MTLRNKFDGKALVSLGAESFRYSYSDVVNMTYVSFGEYRVATMQGKITEDAMLSFVNSVWCIEDNFFKCADDIYNILNSATGFMFNGKEVEEFTITKRDSITSLSDGSLPYHAALLKIKQFGKHYSFSTEYLYKCDFDCDTLEIKSSDRSVLKILTNEFAKKALLFNNK